jgi:serine-type D-Ala-D-Ala carboxypeptidase
MSSRRIRHVADLAREWVERQGVQTLVVLAARRGTIVLHEAWGRMGPEDDAPPSTLNALFDTQSLGKVFTATATMLLVEDGRVGLNRPVSGYLPFFRGDGKDGVLVRHLLTHTSGLRSEDVTRFAKEHEGKVEIPTLEAGMHPLWNEYFSLRADCPLWKPPGEEMSYLSYGYELLGEIVRRVSGEPLDVFCQRRIFGPLGMNDTFCCQVDFPVSRRVRKPPNPSEELDALDRARENERIAFGSGGAYATAYDTAVFAQMLLNGGAYGETRILSPATVKVMTRNQIPGVSSQFFDQHFPEASWGLGFDVRGNKAGWNGALESLQTFGHGGAGAVDFWVDPFYQIVGVCFSAAPSIETSTREWAKYWRNDLFADAVTAAVVEP